MLVGSDCAFAVLGSNSAVNDFPTSVASGLLPPTAILFVVFALAALAVTVPFAVLAVWVAKVTFPAKAYEELALKKASSKVEMRN